MSRPVTDTHRILAFAQDAAFLNDLEATAARLCLHHGEKEWSIHHTSLRFPVFSRIFS